MPDLQTENIVTPHETNEIGKTKIRYEPVTVRAVHVAAMDAAGLAQ
jgi:hypothetical protein